MASYTYPKRGTFLSGSGVPSVSNGLNGNFYLRTDIHKIYQKVNGQWILKGEPLKNGTDDYFSGVGFYTYLGANTLASPITVVQNKYNIVTADNNSPTSNIIGLPSLAYIGVDINNDSVFIKNLTDADIRISAKFLENGWVSGAYQTLPSNATGHYLYTKEGGEGWLILQ